MTQITEKAWYEANRPAILDLVGHLLGGDGATRAAMRAKSADGANALIIECAARMVRAVDLKCGREEVPELSSTDQMTDKEIESRMMASRISNPR